MWNRWLIQAFNALPCGWSEEGKSGVNNFFSLAGTTAVSEVHHSSQATQELWQITAQSWQGLRRTRWFFLLTIYCKKSLVGGYIHLLRLHPLFRVVPRLSQSQLSSQKHIEGQTIIHLYTHLWSIKSEQSEPNQGVRSTVTTRDPTFDHLFCKARALVTLSFCAV